MSQSYRFDRFEVRATERQLLEGGTPVGIGARAIEVLLALLESRERALSKQQLLDRVWPGLDVEENNLAMQVSALRRVLGHRAVITLPGLGYRFGLSVMEDTHPSQPQSSPAAAGQAHAATDALHHRLLAILAADAAGYSRMMALDDRATVAALDLGRSVFREHIASNGGRVIDMAGDSVMSVFDTANGAMHAALAVQRQLARLAEGSPEDRRLQFRIGIHIGDVIETPDGSVYGDGVNIAARLEGLALPGSIAVSEVVHNIVAQRAGVAFDDLGEQSVKNIARPVRVFRAVLGSSATAPESPGSQVLEFDRGRVRIDLHMRQLSVGDLPAKVGSRAFDLLCVLVAHRDRVVSKNELLDLAWPGLVVEENNLQVQVSTLRRLLGHAALTTVPGRGYRFTLVSEADTRPVAAAPAAPPNPARSTNLPPAAEALIGRAADLSALGRLLSEHRLVTILGAGGIGKTRLGQAVARERLADFPGGVWWVDLSALSTDAEVAPAVAAAAGLQLAGGDAVAQLAHGLQGRHALLVLDNCEHLVDGVGRLAAGLIAATSGLRLLATSQVPLRVGDEQAFRVEPLQVPPAGTDLESARTFGALFLLERRAQAVQSRFAISAATLPLAIEICTRLDGLPLAIEMAAARLPLLGFENLVEALQERLRWLKSDRRHALPRQQKLWATLDWSHGLLDERERAVLRRLAVFAGRFSLQGARRVASLADMDEWAVADAMAELADRSLLHVDDQEPPTYRLLESPRAYAAERLQDSGEADAVHDAHLALMSELGDEAEAAYWTTADDPWLARFTPAYEDLQSAFQRACALGDAQAAAATLDALFHIDELREIATALPARLAAASALLPSAAPRAAARIAWCCAAAFAMSTAIPGVSKLAVVRDAVGTWRQSGDAQRRYVCLMALAVHAAVEGDHAEAAKSLAEASSLWAASWPPRLGWVGAVHAYKVHALRGDAGEAIRCSRAELAFAEKAGSACQAANAHANLADALLLSGEVTEAVRVGHEVVARARETGRPSRLALAMLNLAAAQIVADDLAGARVTAQAMVPIAWQDFCGAVLEHLASLAARTGQHVESQLLVGYADRWRAERHWGREGNELAAATHATTLSETALGKTACARLRAEGAHLDDARSRRIADGLVTGAQAIQRSA